MSYVSFDSVFQGKSDTVSRYARTTLRGTRMTECGDRMYRREWEKGGGGGGAEM